MNRESQQDRAVTPAVATILIVVITVVLSTVVTAHFLGFTSKIGGPTAQATFEYAESPVGIEMTPEQIAQDVAVEINGKQVATFDKDDAGNGKLIPTSPGDKLTVVATDGSRSVLVSRTIDDRDEIGDFIAHYTFEGDPGDTVLEDQSGNDNDGDLQNGPNWTGESLEFDGSDDYIDVEDLSSPEPVSEFTIAVTFKQETSGGTQQLIEHYGGGNEWYLENDQSGSKYRPNYAIDHADPNGITRTDGSYATGERRVMIGTYDGSEYELFIDGQKEKSVTYTGDAIEMGDLVIGADAPDGSIQHLDGEIHEIRLYHSAFDDQGIKRISTVME